MKNNRELNFEDIEENSKSKQGEVIRNFAKKEVGKFKKR